MEIKTTVRYHFTPARVAKIFLKRKKKITSVGKDVQKLEPLYIAVGSIKWFSHCVKTV